jgi:pimeloyl-ACP methyl ester carboxylesterase
MDGYRMRYLRAGNGPPLVLIHGLLGYSFSWRFNWQALAEKYTVYAVDLLGIGYSDRPLAGTVPFDLPRTAERMSRWMEQSGIRDAALLGSSHGGGIALAMTAADQKGKSGLISKLILVASVNPWTTVGHHRVRLFSTRIGGLMLKAIAPWLGISRSVMLERMYGERAKVTVETLVGYRKPLMLPRSIDYGLAIARSWGNDLLHLQGCVEAVSDMPVLLIWGDHDRLVPIASGHELKRHLKKADMVVLRGIGHLPYEESPEEFNRILLEFLK